MNALKWIWRNMMRRKGATCLSVASVAAAVALFSLLAVAGHSVERGAATGYGPFDVVVGAEGSPLQLVMNTFYRVGAPTGNIPYDVFMALRNDGSVAAAFAVTAGDSYRGVPIVGVDPAYFRVRYPDAGHLLGRWYASTGEVVVGRTAASELGLRIGDEFHGIHGTAESPEHRDDGHDAFRYRVVGILPRLGTPDDRAVFTTVDYAWAVHGDAERHVTAVVVRPKSLPDAMAIRAKYDRLDGVQAVYSGKAVAELLRQFDSSSRMFGLAVAVCGGLAAVTLALSMAAAVYERMRDIALLRLVGKPRATVVGLLVGESVALAAVGALLGALLGLVAAYVFREPIARTYGFLLEPWPLPPELRWLAAAVVAVGVVASLVPAHRAYRLDPLTLFRP